VDSKEAAPAQASEEKKGKKGKTNGKAEPTKDEALLQAIPDEYRGLVSEALRTFYEVKAKQADTEKATASSRRRMEAARRAADKAGSESRAVFLRISRNFGVGALFAVLGVATAAAIDRYGAVKQRETDRIANKLSKEEKKEKDQE